MGLGKSGQAARGEREGAPPAAAGEGSVLWFPAGLGDWRHADGDGSPRKPGGEPSHVGLDAVWLHAGGNGAGEEGLLCRVLQG